MSQPWVPRTSAAPPVVKKVPVTPETTPSRNATRALKNVNSPRSAERPKNYGSNLNQTPRSLPSPGSAVSEIKPFIIDPATTLTPSRVNRKESTQSSLQVLLDPEDLISDDERYFEEIRPKRGKVVIL